MVWTFKDVLVVPKIRPLDLSTNVHATPQAETERVPAVEPGRYELFARPFFRPEDTGDFLFGEEVLERIGLGSDDPPAELQHGLWLNENQHLFPDDLPASAYVLLAGTVVHQKGIRKTTSQFDEERVIPYFNNSAHPGQPPCRILKWFGVLYRFPLNGVILYARPVG